MRYLTSILLLSLSFSTFSQEDVIILFNQPEVTSTDSLHITIFLQASEEIEIAVFTNDKLFDARLARIDKGKTDYVFPLTGIWKGKFILLVDGESFHEEFEFAVK
ncbi:MAG: hypothetical protein SH856_11520 [Flavobacteriales bacterium]|nr:hypothetical protein [Flavobacteriales bacterium]